jgi:hypothetical protein
MTSYRSDPVHFLPADKLPKGFEYPASYRAFVAANPDCVLGPVNEDWCFIDSRMIEDFIQYIRNAAPGIPLVPFMRRNGDDGVVCFFANPPEEPKVWGVNCFQDVGYVAGTRTFSEWLASIPVCDEDD